jgi:hypothetical protein
MVAFAALTFALRLTGANAKKVFSSLLDRIDEFSYTAFGDERLRLRRLERWPSG